MAIQHINSGDTNDAGRLKANAAFDEIITGTTQSINNGEIILNKRGGGTITGNFNIPSYVSKPSIMYALGNNMSALTFSISPGRYYLSNNEVQVPLTTGFTFPVNADPNEEAVHAVYVTSNGTIKTHTLISAGTAYSFVEPGDIATIAVAYAAPANGPVTLEQTVNFNKEIKLKTTESGQLSDYFGGVAYSQIGGYIPRVEITSPYKSIAVETLVNNSFSMGKFNEVYASNASVFGGKWNKVTTPWSSIVGGSGNTITSAQSMIIGGADNKIFSGNSSDRVVMINCFDRSNADAYSNSVVMPNLHVLSGMSFRTSSVSSDYQASLNDYHLAVDTISSAIEITLPSGQTNGHMLIVKDSRGNAAANNITLLPQNSSTIDGDTGKTLISNYISVSVMYNTSLDTWMII